MRFPAALIAVCILASACTQAAETVDVQALANAYAAAVNRKDLDAVVSLWSEDAELVFLPG